MTLDLGRIARRTRDGIAWIVIVGVFAIGGLAAPASTQDAGALARQANTQLRSAERAMFAGELESAQQQLAVVDDLLAQIEALDPKHAQLVSLARKRAKLAADIGRRVKKDPPTVEKGEKPTPETSSLPGPVSKRLRDVDAQLTRLRTYLASDSAVKPESRVQTARSYVEKARSVLAQIEERYGRQVPADHPELVANRQRIDAAEQEIATSEARWKAAVDASAARPAAAPALDRAQVEELYERFADDLDLIHGNTLVYGPRLQNAQSALEQLTGIETDVLPVLQPALAELVQRYGERAMQIDRKLQELGVPTQERFANDMERLVEGVRNFASSKAACAESIANNAAMMLDGVDRLPEHVRVPRMEEQQQILRIGQQLAPNDARINALLADLDQRIVAVSEQIERDIDARTWAGSIDDFAGPGDVASLTEAAFGYFRTDERWGRHESREIEVLAVAIRGPWQVADRDIFGRVIRWRLPIHLAITDAAMRPEGLARVYELSLVGMEGAADQATKAPPFDGYWVGDSHAMRLAKVPIAQAP